jgi:hypothetical protein
MEGPPTLAAGTGAGVCWTELVTSRDGREGTSASGVMLEEQPLKSSVVRKNAGFIALCIGVRTHHMSGA